MCTIFVYLVMFPANILPYKLLTSENKKKQIMQGLFKSLSYKFHAYFCWKTLLSANFKIIVLAFPMQKNTLQWILRKLNSSFLLSNKRNSCHTKILKCRTLYQMCRNIFSREYTCSLARPGKNSKKIEK